MMSSPDSESVEDRLEYLRSQIEAESISYGEIAELQGLAQYIDEGDVQLLEWAGVSEGPGITLTRGQLEAWAGRTLTNEEVEQLDEAIPNSSIPEAIATIVESLTEEES